MYLCRRPFTHRFFGYCEFYQRIRFGYYWTWFHFKCKRSAKHWLLPFHNILKRANNLTTSSYYMPNLMVKLYKALIDLHKAPICTRVPVKIVSKDFTFRNSFYWLKNYRVHAFLRSFHFLNKKVIINSYEAGKYDEKWSLIAVTKKKLL